MRLQACAGVLGFKSTASKKSLDADRDKVASDETQLRLIFAVGV